MAGSYEVDTLVRLSASFTTVSGGTATDPTEVKLFVKPPTGSVQTFTLSAAQVVKDSVGNYHYDYLVNAVGAFQYKWQGTGAVQVTTPDGSMNGNNTVFTAQL